MAKLSFSDRMGVLGIMENVIAEGFQKLSFWERGIIENMINYRKPCGRNWVHKKWKINGKPDNK